VKLKKQKRPVALKTGDTHPYSTTVVGEEPIIHVSLKAAKTKLINTIQDFHRSMSMFGPTNAEEVINAIQTVGVDGGDVDEVLDIPTGLRFRCSIRKRTA
jgi:hypothetical protein